MQKFSKEELQEQAEKFMKAHNVDSFLATEDGNFFHPDNKNYAHDHNNKNVKGEVFEFSMDNGQVTMDNGQLKIENEVIPDPADEPEEVITQAPISIDVERHGEPIPEPKPKAQAKPKGKSKRQEA